MPNGMYLITKFDKPRTLLELAQAGQEMAALVGHLGKDPELRYTASGLAICKGSVAVSWGKRGEADQHTEWCDYAAWRETGELMAAEFHKGDAVCLIGKLGTNTFKTRDGEERTVGQLTVYDVARVLWKKRDSVVVPKTPASSQPVAVVPDVDIPF